MKKKPNLTINTSAQIENLNSLFGYITIEDDKAQTSCVEPLSSQAAFKNSVEGFIMSLDGLETNDINNSKKTNRDSDQELQGPKNKVQRPVQKSMTKNNTILR